MTALAIVVGVVAVLVLGVLVGRELRRASLPVECEQCEVCSAWVPTSEAVVITETFGNDGEIGGWVGGTGMSASYCREHAPSLPSPE